MSDARAKELGLLLRRWRLARGLKRPEVIAELKRREVELSSAYLAKLESGERSFASASIDIREGLRQLLAIPRDEWERTTGLYTPPLEDDVSIVDPALLGRTRQIPVFDLLSAGPGGDGGVLTEDPVEIPDTWRGPHVGYKVMGDSMLPDIRPDSVVIVKVQDYASPGNIIVAFVPERGMVVKVLESITDTGEYVLVSSNPAYRPIWAADIRIYGVVREVRNTIPVINGNHRPN